MGTCSRTENMWHLDELRNLRRSLRWEEERWEQESAELIPISRHLPVEDVTHVSDLKLVLQEALRLVRKGNSKDIFTTFRLRYSEGLSTVSVSRLLGVSTTTVKRRLDSALTTLYRHKWHLKPELGRDVMPQHEVLYAERQQRRLEREAEVRWRKVQEEEKLESEELQWRTRRLGGCERLVRGDRG